MRSEATITAAGHILYVFKGSNMRRAMLASTLALAITALVVSGATSQSPANAERAAGDGPGQAVEVEVVESRNLYRDPLAAKLGDYLHGPEGEMRQQLREELQKRRAELRKRLAELEAQAGAEQAFGHQIELRELLREYFGQQEIARVIMQLEEIEWRYPRSDAAAKAKEAIQALRSADGQQ